MKEGRVYVASSWRNYAQQLVVAILNQAGLQTYDFRHPSANDNGFGWRQLDENWQDWSTEEYIEKLQTPIAQQGFDKDIKALDDCFATVMVLPCGSSASLELGYAIGRFQSTIVYIPPAVKIEPELMFLAADLITESIDQVIAHLLKARGKL